MVENKSSSADAARNPNNNKHLKLVNIPINPWSERVRFALHVAGLIDGVEIIDYTPLFDEVYLRRLLGVWNPNTKVSVPVLIFDDRTAMPESVEIGKWAAKHSNGKLKLPDDLETFDRIVVLTDKVLEAGRFRSTARAASSGAFDVESLPPILKHAPTFVTRSIFSRVSRFVHNKYAKKDWTMQTTLVQARDNLKALDEIRTKNGGKFMVGNEFTLADVIASSAMSFISALPKGFSRAGPNTAKAWLDEPELASEFADFQQWRDVIYLDRRGDNATTEGKSNKIKATN